MIFVRREGIIFYPWKAPAAVGEATPLEVECLHPHIRAYTMSGNWDLIRL
jgi:hypothetical protein